MTPNAIAELLFRVSFPLGSPFLAVGTVLLLPVLERRVSRPAVRLILLGGLYGAYLAAYRLAAADPEVERALARVHSPFFSVFLFVILPAMRLSGQRARRLFAAWPAALLILLVLAVIEGYRGSPGGFHWFAAPAHLVVAGMASLLVLVRPAMSLQVFRATVKTVFFLLLIYGGFALRQDRADYLEAIGRRSPGTDFMLLSETRPVKGSPERMVHLPSAPCRFAADGGFVQGCNLELWQRILQVDYRGVAAADPNQLGALNLAAGSLLIFFFLSFLAGRAFCGWACPLQALGSIMDRARKRIGKPALRLSRRVKKATLAAGLSLAGITLVMARFLPFVDQNGFFRGCRIPAYPFCKICPGQQICPVAAGGPGMYPGLPTGDWGFGFFRLALVGLLVFFAVAFTVGRRWWCRLCPMGMISGFFNRGAAPALVKDAVRCNRCGVCMEVCPMDIDHVRKEMQRPEVATFDCVYCLKCLSRCPRRKCLSFRYAGRTLAESE